MILLCRSAHCCGWSGVDLALPERALLRSPRGSRTQVHSPRFSLAKPARLCDITAYKLGWSMCRLTATRVVCDVRRLRGL